MCLKEVGLHGQNKMTILNSIINMILIFFGGGGVYDHLMSTKNFFDNK
jgi:hypothetical protein